MKCKMCGRELPETEKFCGSCGSAVEPPTTQIDSAKQKRKLKLFIGLVIAAIVILAMLAGLFIANLIATDGETPYSSKTGSESSAEVVYPSSDSVSNQGISSEPISEDDSKTPIKKRHFETLEEAYDAYIEEMDSEYNEAIAALDAAKAQGKDSRELANIAGDYNEKMAETYADCMETMGEMVGDDPFKALGLVNTTANLTSKYAGYCAMLEAAYTGSEITNH